MLWLEVFLLALGRGGSAHFGHLVGLILLECLLAIE